MTTLEIRELLGLKAEESLIDGKALITAVKNGLERGVKALIEKDPLEYLHWLSYQDRYNQVINYTHQMLDLHEFVICRYFLA